MSFANHRKASFRLSCFSLPTSQGKKTFPHRSSRSKGKLLRSSRAASALFFCLRKFIQINCIMLFSTGCDKAKERKLRPRNEITQNLRAPVGFRFHSSFGVGFYRSSLCLCQQHNSTKTKTINSSRSEFRFQPPHWIIYSIWFIFFRWVFVVSAEKPKEPKERNIRNFTESLPQQHTKEAFFRIFFSLLFTLLPLGLISPPRLTTSFEHLLGAIDNFESFFFVVVFLSSLLAQTKLKASD